MVIMMMLMLLISINDFGGDDAAAYDGDGDDNGKYVAMSWSTDTFLNALLCVFA